MSWYMLSSKWGFLSQRTDGSSNKGLQDLKSEKVQNFHHREKKRLHIILFLFLFFQFRSSLQSVAEHSWITVCTDQAINSFMTYVFS